MNPEKYNPEFSQIEKEPIKPIKEVESKLTREQLEWYHDSFELNGKTIENIGVYHDPTAIEEYGEEIQEAIKKASIVMLEGAPTVSGRYSEEYIDHMIKSAHERGVNLDREKVLEQLKKETGYAFFKAMEDMAAKEGKLVAVADPNDIDYLGGEKEIGKNERVRNVNDNIDLIRLGLFLAGLVGLSGPRLKELFSSVKENKISEEKISRRSFLRKLGKGLGSLALLPMIIEFLNSGDEASGIARDVAYDWYDFRDVVSAKGLDILSKKDLGNGNILLIYASPHSKAIQHYALRPEKTDTKLDLYKPLKEAADPQLRIYKSDNNSWQLVGKESIE